MYMNVWFICSEYSHFGHCALPCTENSRWPTEHPVPLSQAGFVGVYLQSKHSYWCQEEITRILEDFQNHFLHAKCVLYSLVLILLLLSVPISHAWLLKTVFQPTHLLDSEYGNVLCNKNLQRQTCSLVSNKLAKMLIVIFLFCIKCNLILVWFFWKWITGLSYKAISLFFSFQTPTCFMTSEHDINQY